MAKRSFQASGPFTRMVRESKICSLDSAASTSGEVVSVAPGEGPSFSSAAPVR